MRLQDTLNAMKEKSAANLPPETRQIMQRATEDLENSGIMEQVLQPGATMPHFTLPDEQDRQEDSQKLLDKGPLVVSFYRGVW